MRKVLTIVVAAIMVVAIVGAASAASSETAWRINMKADNGEGGGYGANLTMGVATNTTDGFDAITGTDNPTNFGADFPSSGRWATSLIPGQTGLYTSNIMSNASPYTYPKNQKIWQVRVAALPNADAKPIRLQFLATNTNPLATRNGLPVFFQLKMIDNKGVAGAPANGTKWMIPIPTQAANQSFWSIDTAADMNGVVWGNLPLIKLGTASHAAMIADGYQMEFRMVPEPSSMLAMGSGLAGLIGFAVRRRRA